MSAVSRVDIGKCYQNNCILSQMFNEWKIPLNIWTHYLPSTSQPILCRSHHRSRHGDAPAPPMIIILIFVSSPTRAWRTATATRLCIGCSLTDIAKRKEDEVLNYFINRSTNAHAESLNSKLKGFRAQLRGVQDLPFFMFRASVIFG